AARVEDPHTWLLKLSHCDSVRDLPHCGKPPVMFFELVEEFEVVIVHSTGLPIVLLISLVVFDCACQTFFDRYSRFPPRSEIELCRGTVNTSKVDRLVLRRKRNNAIRAVSGEAQ